MELQELVDCLYTEGHRHATVIRSKADSVLPSKNAPISWLKLHKHIKNVITHEISWCDYLHHYYYLLFMVNQNNHQISTRTQPFQPIALGILRVDAAPAPAT